uniref:Uncharacterized protein n=1 Tax=Rhizophora mucronata TaxID=61149 RepID=A0A2P2QIH4_RHIMU
MTRCSTHMEIQARRE